MGWSTWADRRPTDTILREQFAHGEQKVLASATVGSTWYAALACRDPANSNEIVTALVVLFTRGRGGRFGCKTMDETMGPYERRCPARILGMLSPLERFAQPGFAAAWRRDCEAASGPVTPELARLGG